MKITFKQRAVFSLFSIQIQIFCSGSFTLNKNINVTNMLWNEVIYLNKQHWCRLSHFYQGYTKSICLSTFLTFSIANDLLESMDTSIDPCEDFYSYVCGNFIKNHELPDGVNSIGTMGIMSQYVTNVLNGIKSWSLLFAINYLWDYFTFSEILLKPKEENELFPIHYLKDHVAACRNISKWG